MHKTYVYVYVYIDQIIYHEHQGMEKEQMYHTIHIIRISVESVLNGMLIYDH